MKSLQAPKQALYSAPDKPIFYTDDSMISAKLLSIRFVLCKPLPVNSLISIIIKNFQNNLKTWVPQSSCAQKASLCVCEKYNG